ncbi:hypothetical protein TUM4644_08350 [Shewanella colwelliana]|uniref:hypothetical protein n=1 Tax=Shewanella colwelliana TaxID=23 RepID=UPI001BBD183B|nr:hypothetical protein [Shewanella colwelliana]GIU19923.1 hypothetical protein TUM4644_08350 [Shewanella colwelliana]
MYRFRLSYSLTTKTECWFVSAVLLMLACHIAKRSDVRFEQNLLTKDCICNNPTG